MAYKTRADLLAEVERLQGEVLLLRTGIAGMDQAEAHRLRLEAIEADGRAKLAEQGERIARSHAERCQAAIRPLLNAVAAMAEVDPLGENHEVPK